jgi:hypothetical protein
MGIMNNCRSRSSAVSGTQEGAGLWRCGASLFRKGPWPRRRSGTSPWQASSAVSRASAAGICSSHAGGGGLGGEAGRPSLVAAAVGGQSCWLPVQSTENPAAWMKSWRSSPRFATRSASPRWNRTWGLVASWCCRAWRCRPDLGGGLLGDVAPGRGSSSQVHGRGSASSLAEQAAHTDGQLASVVVGASLLSVSFRISAYVWRRWLERRRW